MKDIEQIIGEVLDLAEHVQRCEATAPDYHRLTRATKELHTAAKLALASERAVDARARQAISTCIHLWRVADDEGFRCEHCDQYRLRLP